jgi:formylglycine-generating enzyme required for sulfatase activity
LKADADFKLAKMESLSSGGQTHDMAVFSHEKTGLEFVLVPSGTFQMGSPTTERGRDPDETPQHAVTLTRPFLICRTECTQAAYEKVVGSNPSELKTPARPVETVSWNDVKAFCDRVDLRLPTEAEWEYACRAGTTTAYCFGDDEAQLHEYAWFSGGSDGQRTAPVAQRKPNGFGLYDMHGNVWEWCADWRAAYTSGSATDPSADVGTFRASRGGSSENGYANSRSAKRGGGAPDDEIRARGFRPAKSVGP